MFAAARTCGSRTSAAFAARWNHCDGQLDERIRRDDVPDFRAVYRPPGMPTNPLGDERIVAERLGSGVSQLKLTRVNYQFGYPFGPADVVGVLPAELRSDN
jgi:hypothetical protein